MPGLRKHQRFDCAEILFVAIKKQEKLFTFFIKSVMFTFFLIRKKNIFRFLYHAYNNLTANDLFNKMGDTLKTSIKNNTITFLLYYFAVIAGMKFINLPPGNKIEIKVKDSGIGINRDKQHRIFEPFFQGDASLSKKYGGTGLGLPVIKKSIDLLQGNISVKTVEGNGTEITIVLPYQLAVPIKEIEKRAEETSDRKENGQNLIKIISVEDIEINQLLLGKILKDQPWEITKVSSGKELLRALEKELYDISLMDIQMPEMNGIEATKNIKMNPAYTAIPIIAV